MSSNEVSAKNNLPFLYTWKLERLFLSTPSSGKLWEYSSVFPAGGYMYLQLYPKGVLEEEDKSISVFLANGSSPTPSVNISAEVYIGWVDQINGKNQYRRGPQMIFNKTSSWGWIKFLSFDELREPSKGILVNDTCILNVGFFTYDIAKCLQLYPRGRSEEEDKSISLYLQLVNAAIPAPSGKIHAEYYFDWVDQIKGRNHHDRTHQIFDCKQPTWGWKKFLSLDALHEPSKGFLVNDTCIIKVGFLQWDNISK
ncbi:hypothetical protein Taro_011808 [Colocasia esculenta]|uniref:MATH domain-containing protein n=1 Tax=Colocasia esculenta TaxID=4460 RepID=A0A843U7D8_COLES|nr:hypothetical protein [Colocasia esculenta]